MFEDVLRFWLDRGVDGFRVDVAHGLFKEESLRDQRSTRRLTAQLAARGLAWSSATPATSRCGTSPRSTTSTATGARILDEYDGDRMAVAEAWTQTPESMAAFVRPDELQQTFNFAWLLAPWSAAGVRRGHPPARSPRSSPVGANPTWVLTQPRRRPARDAVRRRRRRPGPRPRRDAGDAGAARLGVPLPGRGARPREVDVARRTPAGPGLVPHRRVEWRDGCRVPIPWEGAQAPYGFGPGASSRGSRSPPTGPA